MEIGERSQLPAYSGGDIRLTAVRETAASNGAAARAAGGSDLFDYQTAFESAVEQVKAEGRYRVFADLKRVRGQFRSHGLTVY